MVYRAVASDNADPPAILLNPPHRASQDDPLAERGGHRLGNADRPAGNPVLLSSLVDRDEPVATSAGDADRSAGIRPPLPAASRAPEAGRGSAGRATSDLVGP
jgi:hypothetical protein